MKNNVVHQYISTPLGNLSLLAESSSVGGEAWDLASRIFTKSVEPELPHGMSVLGCDIVLLQCAPGEASEGVTFECSWANDAPLCTGPETGEWLEAQSWEGLGYKIVIGTEDYDCFAKRLGSEIAISASQYSVLYSDRGIQIQVGPLAGGVQLSLHFVVSWNRPPDPADCSCWYAVGMSHPTVLSYAHFEGE